MLPTDRLDDAERLTRSLSSEITEPPFAPPTKRFRYSGAPITTPGNRPQIRLDGRDMPEFHPILATDYFEYGTSVNRPDKEGAAVETGDAALGLACAELADPPPWAAVRNMSDPTINGDLPSKEFPLNEQTTWAVGYFTAYGEGWGLYAETLGFELGLYTDAYSRYGHLQWQAFRAARLVADTGVHNLGWTRAQTIDFMVERTGVEREFVASEVDRYTSDPGQALAYMIGKLKFDELRDRAKARLGARFDIRTFHNAVLDNGALPLATLDGLVNEWIAAQPGS